MPASIVRADLRDWARTIVISDVHAHASLLSRLLETLRFCERDLLVIAGDLLLRGKENLPTLRLAMELARRPNAVILGGNCDDVIDVLLSMPDGDKLKGYFRQNSFCHELLAPLSPPPGADCAVLRGLIREHYAHELRFLRERPDILDTPQAVFVHGGLPDGDLKNASAWDSAAVRKFDDYLHHAPVLPKPVVVGHWPCCLYRDGYPDATPFWDGIKNLLSIDGGLGVKPDGQLNAVVIPRGEFEAREYFALDELPRVRALSSQEESAYSFYIRYGDDRVEAEEEKDGFTYVRHMRTGRGMWVPSPRLWTGEDGLLRCGDSTDWKPQVAPRDVLSLVADTSRGYLIKKNGATGWYRGAVEYM
ncbi:MAG: metallophosphoesterase [Clostridiaceae bacterium]|nr:metallophosphoesterase [Clostridiaceae bacterium]